MTIFKLGPRTELIVALCSVFVLLVANGRYDLSVKEALKAAGGVGFTYPACSAYAHVPGQTYTSGQQVSYRG